NADARLRIFPHPMAQIPARSVSDAVTPLPAPEAGAVSVAEEHVVSAVAVENVGTRLRLVLFDPALDQVPVGFRPMDPVRRGRHADLVDGLGPSVHRLPLSARDVPQVPGVVEEPDLG